MTFIDLLAFVEELYGKSLTGYQRERLEKIVEELTSNSYHEGYKDGFKERGQV